MNVCNVNLRDGNEIIKQFKTSTATPAHHAKVVAIQQNFQE
jgi:hypothetical protein